MTASLLLHVTVKRPTQKQKTKKTETKADKEEDVELSGIYRSQPEYGNDRYCKAL